MNKNLTCELCKRAKKDYIKPEMKVVEMGESPALLCDSGEICFDVTENISNEGGADEGY